MSSSRTPASAASKAPSSTASSTRPVTAISVSSGLATRVAAHTASRSAVPPLGHRGEVDVVLHADRRAERAPELADQAGAVQAGDVDVVDGVGTRVVGARYPELQAAQPVDGYAGGGALVGDGVPDGRLDGDLVEVGGHLGAG